jgi:hypothetical protein
MIVKVCKIHGELTDDQVRKEKNNQMKNGYQLRCLECRRDKDRTYKLNNPDKHKDSVSRKRSEDRRLFREGLSKTEPKANLWAKEDRKKNPEKHLKWAADYRERTGQLRNTMEVCRRFKLDVSEYYRMKEEQNNLCKICNQPETRKSRTEGKICALAIDHCHTTGKTRSLLCHSCNVSLGAIKEDIEVLKSMIDYLES